MGRLEVKKVRVRGEGGRLEAIPVGLQRQATYYLPLTTHYLLLTLRLSLSACSGTLETLSIRRASGRCAW